MQTPEWYLNRLRLMSAGEIAWRVQQAFTGRFALGAGGARAPAARQQAARLPEWPAPRLAAPRGDGGGHGDGDSDGTLAHADEILAGRLEIFDAAARYVNGTPDWNRDPQSGILAPNVRGDRLDYRDARLVGSARHIWELNRHTSLVSLGQAYALSGDERYRDGARRLVASWLGECPWPIGINWVSALEHAIRLINWYAAARLLRWSGAEAEPVAGWHDAIHRQCSFIWRHRSRHSSANNHLIGEMAGLYVAASAWPCWDESARWRDRARRILEEEAGRQVHADGVGREQTVGYQIFVLQFLIAAGLVGESGGEPFPQAYWERVRAMIGFLRSIENSDGSLPDIGDADDGMVWLLSPDARARRFEDLRDFEDRLDGMAPRARKVDAAGAGHGGDAWLATGFPAPRAWPRGAPGRASGASGAERRAFPDGGYYILGERDAARIVFDAGPLGYLSIAAHGHADALSFTLAIAGEPVLIDPGTYCYHSDPLWRDYFRGTGAHNTLLVDGEDQSERAGPFMWLRKAQAFVDGAELAGARPWIRARHDGYERLADPVTHSRELRLDTTARTLLVNDRVGASGAHVCERRWHFAAQCAVHALGGGSLEVRSARSRLRIHAADADEIEILRGAAEPRAGWWSPRFGELRETTTVILRNATRGEARLGTRFEWETP